MLLWRGLWDRSYWRNFGERFGFGPALAPGGVWLHAVSVGEVQACAPLVAALHRRIRSCPLTVTTFTPTGAARARALFGNVAQVRYVPYDLPGAVRRFFARVQPRLAVIFETELWPNLYRECGQRRVPLVLASARLSPRSVGRYQRLGRLFTDTLSHAAVVAAQATADAERFRSLGADAASTHVTGNLKFDFELPADIQARGARAARAVRRRAPGLGRGQHARRRRGGGADCRTATGAGQRRRGAAGDGAAPPAALRRGRGGADAGRGALHAPLAQQQRRGRLRSAAVGYPRGAIGFLRRRGRGLCRRQPGAGRRAQPARAGGAWGAAPHRPVHLQQRGHRAAADRAGRSRGGAQRRRSSPPASAACCWIRRPAPASARAAAPAWTATAARSRSCSA